MKITRIETIPVRVPIKPALAIRSGRGGSHIVSPFLLVCLQTDDGIIGVGEASCTPRWSGEDQVSAAHFIDSYFAPALIGEEIKDAADVDRLYARFAPLVAGNYFTKAAVEMALWDAAGKLLETPLWQLLAAGDNATTSPARNSVELSVPIKWSVSGVEPRKAAEIASWAVGQGFTRMKVKVGIDPEGDVERVKAVRETVGASVKLGVDANGGWPTAQLAIDTIKRLRDECDINFAEQPIPAGDNAAMAEVRRNVTVPIIADESVYTLADAKMLARAEAADVFSIYIGKAGGIGPARQIAEFAKSVGIASTIGSNLELGVGSAAMIHVALGTGGIDADNYPCDIIGPLFYEDDILSEPLKLSGGLARPCIGHGLGVELDMEKVEKYRVR
jgi:muconate cycloisomerase